MHYYWHYWSMVVLDLLEFASLSKLQSRLVDGLRNERSFLVGPLYGHLPKRRKWTLLQRYSEIASSRWLWLLLDWTLLLSRPSPSSCRKANYHSSVGSRSSCICWYLAWDRQSIDSTYSSCEFCYRRLQNSTGRRREQIGACASTLARMTFSGSAYPQVVPWPLHFQGHCRKNCGQVYLQRHDCHSCGWTSVRCSIFELLISVLRTLGSDERRLENCPSFAACYLDVYQTFWFLTLLSSL